MDLLFVAHKLDVRGVVVVEGELQRVQQRRAAADLRHHWLESDAGRREEGADLVQRLERGLGRRHDGLPVALAPHVHLEIARMDLVMHQH